MGEPDSLILIISDDLWEQSEDTAYVVLEPTDNNRLPYRDEPVFDLSDGPHIGYAIQWFTFALILGLGYIGYVGKHIKKVASSKGAGSGAKLLTNG